MFKFEEIIKIEWGIYTCTLDRNVSMDNRIRYVFVLLLRIFNNKLQTANSKPKFYAWNYVFSIIFFCFPSFSSSLRVKTSNTNAVNIKDYKYYKLVCPNVSQSTSKLFGNSIITWFQYEMAISAKSLNCKMYCLFDYFVID